MLITNGPYIITLELKKNINNDKESRIEMTNKELYKDLLEEFKILKDK